MIELQLIWDTGPIQVLNQDQLEAEYSNTNLFSPDTWVVWKDGEVTRGLYGSLLDLLPEMEPGEVWTCDNVSIQGVFRPGWWDVPLYSTEVQKCVGTKVVQADDGFGGTYPVKVGPRSHVGKTVDEVYALVNEIYSLFDEGLITLAEAELALGLEGEASHG